MTSALGLLGGLVVVLASVCVYLARRLGHLQAQHQALEQRYKIRQAQLKAALDQPRTRYDVVKRLRNHLF